MTNLSKKDDPHDDITNWLEGLRKREADKPEHSTKQSVGGSKGSDIQRKKPPEEERKQKKPNKPD